MPIPYILMVAAQIGFIIHAARTGRPYYWLMILLFIPMFGILAYVIIELIPGATRSPTGNKAFGTAKRLVDPQGDYRKLALQLEITPTVANACALADECVCLGKLDEAEMLYRNAMTGIHATDPAPMLGIARARFGQDNFSGRLEALAKLREANPDYQNGDAHMLYARSLDALSRNDEALAEYESLSRYFGGEGPRIRRALLPRRTGDIEAARAAFAEIKRSIERSPSFYRRNQREWYRVAADNLKA